MSDNPAEGSQVEQPATSQVDTPQTTAPVADLSKLENLPASWQQEIKSLRTENAKRRKADEERQAAEMTETQRLQAQVDKLSPLEAQTTTLTEQLAARDELIDRLMKARIKALPEGFQNILKRARDVTERAELLEDLEKEAGTLAAQRSPGTPSGPRGSGGQPAATVGTMDDLVARKRSSGYY